MAEDGFRLDRLLSRHKALPANVVLELGIRLCEAAQEAWRLDRKGLAGPERDIEPSTIHVTPEGLVPVRDFGLSDMTPAEGDPSAVYRSPEALEGHGGTPASDVFVIGAVLYEMATGQPLFCGRRAASGDSFTRGLDLRLSVAGIPAKLDDMVQGLGKVVLRCLQLDHAERWPEPGVVARALRKVQEHAGLAPPDLAAFLAGRGEAPGKIASVEPGSEPALPPGNWTALAGSAARSTPPDAARDPGRGPVAGAGGDGRTAAPGAAGLPALPDLPEVDEPAAPRAATSTQGAPKPPAQPSPFKLQVDVPDDRDEAAKAAPWAADERQEERVVERMSHRRLTPVARAVQHKRKDPTFGGAVRWFLRRVLLWVALLLAVLLAVAYFGVFPGATERRLAGAWDAIPEAARAAVPERWVGGIRAWWEYRPAGQAGRPVGRWLLRLLPPDWRTALMEEPPTPPPTAGEGRAEGVAVSAQGWIGPGREAGEGKGRLSLGFDLGGRARGEKVHVKARPAVSACAVGSAPGPAGGGAAPSGGAALATPGPASDVVAEGSGDQPLDLPPGCYDVELLYSESASAGDFPGWLRGIQVTAGLATHFAVRMSAPVGFVRASMQREDEDVTDRARLEGWREPIDGEPQGPPAFTGPPGEESGIPAGRWRIRVIVDEAGRAPAVRWFPDVRIDAGERTTLQATDFLRGELLDPPGPGIRVVASNFGRDVSERSQVLVFRAGSNPKTAVASATGPAAYYFDVPTGVWDVQVVYQPDPSNISLRCDKVVHGVHVAERGVTRLAVDLDLALGELRLRVRQDGEDVSSALEVVAIRAGASFEGATRAVDADGGGPHPIAPGTWDVYADLELPRETLHARFKDVVIARGDTWEKSLDTTDPDWGR